MSISASASERLGRFGPGPLKEAVLEFLAARAVESRSEHTLRNYAIELEQFLDHLAGRGVGPWGIGVSVCRAWRAGVFVRGLGAVWVCV
ncbi:MAG: hypothetical protein ACK532_04335, partial [Acidobacteriota bacterium]